MRARIAKDLVGVLDQAEAATADGQSLPDTTQFSLLQAALGGPFDGLLTTADPDIALIASSKIGRLATALAPRADLRSTGDRTISGPTTGEEDTFDGAEAARWLNDNLFTDANHAGDGVYKVPASLVCTQTAYDDQGNAIGDVLDTECAQAFDKIELRIRVSTDDALLRFAVQLGPDHDEPIEVGLGPSLLSLTVDLDETEEAARALAGKLGGELPTFALDGRVTATLAVAPAIARLALDIDRGVWIRFAEPGVGLDDPGAFSFSSVAANVFEVSLDGTARSMEATLGLGATKLHVPDEVDGTIDLDLPGVSGTATYQVGQPLRLSDVSLGNIETTLKVDGALALSLALNPNDGRQFDATITGDLLEVSPRFELRSQVNHAALGDEAPVYDVTRIFLEGGLRGRGEDQVEVVGGTFAIDTNPASYGFAAGSGQCVTGTEAFDQTRGELYTQFAVGACN